MQFTIGLIKHNVKRVLKFKKGGGLSLVDRHQRDALDQRTFCGAVCSVTPRTKHSGNLLLFGIDLINNTLTVRISASRYIVMLAAAAAAAATGFLYSEKAVGVDISFWPLFLAA